MMLDRQRVTCDETRHESKRNVGRKAHLNVERLANEDAYSEALLYVPNRFKYPIEILQQA